MAESYPTLPGRNRPLTLGAVAAGLAVLFIVVGIWWSGGGSASSGPLSSSHSGLETNCQACHRAFESVAESKCLDCHDRQSAQPGLHTLEAHYRYGSGEFTRGAGRVGEIACHACHPEHRGRDASLTPASSGPCQGCHHFGPFGTSHPDFELKRRSPEGTAGGPNFSHNAHMQALEVAPASLEEACARCHVPLPPGKRFAPIDFEAHCEGCHEAESSAGLTLEKDLRILRRAEFDHSAHAIERRCTQCHVQIGISDPGLEDSESRQLGIQVCRECHNSGQASERCTLCHRFHPHSMEPAPR